jgi:3-oxoacyl-[acyl-carrier-protein] synthase II
MAQPREVVITGLGVVAPLGIGVDSFWKALCTGVCGIRPIASFDASQLPVQIAAEIVDFDPLQFVKPRKSLKVMARDSQLALAAAGMAREHARLPTDGVDPERFAAIFGADTINPVIEDSVQSYAPCMSDGKFVYDRWGTAGMQATYPLNMLRLLPNMLTCHVSIAHDARGPCNTAYQNEASSLLAVGEAESVIRRGLAEVALAGGASSRMRPLDWARALAICELSQQNDQPDRACLPFDAARRGQVRGEGAAALVLEERRRAENRGATILARILGWSCAHDGRGAPGTGIRRAVAQALQCARLSASEIGHVNAHGLGTRAGDAIEAAALADVLPSVPVLAAKSYFGNACAAGGALEMAVSLLAIINDRVPPTLGHRQTAPDCPIRVLCEPLIGAQRPALLLNFTDQGQAVAMILGAA